MSTLFWIAVAAPTSDLSAQVSAADSASVLLGAASHFEIEGRRGVAAAIYEHLLERFPETPAAVEARRLLEAVRAAGGEDEGSGRVELQVWATLFGLWSGIALPAALGADGPEAYGVGLLVGGPVGLLVARAAMRSRSFSEGQTRAVTWGGTWGTWQGLGWYEVLDWGEREVCTGGVCYLVDEGDEERFASMLVGGLAGVATGAVFARGDVASGVASGAHYGSLWGTWLGVAGSVLLDLDEGDQPWTMTLLAGNAGLVGGALLARSARLSRDRLRLISVGGVIGGLGGAGIDLIAQPDGEKVVMAIPLVGSLVGLGVATHLTRDRDRTRDRADAGAGTGALVRLAAGQWRLDLPGLVPTVREAVSADGRPRWVPAVRVDLLRARF